MEEDLSIAAYPLSEISISANRNNEPVTIHGSSKDLNCIGVGTDAAVFKSIHAPSYVFKLYAEEKKSKIPIEANVYETLGKSPFFSTCIAFTDTYLVLTYEEGMNLFDCLLHGIHIPKQVIQDVEDAREYVFQRNLNPRDIHLKNILLQNGRAKIIDVSEYVKPGNDYRWDHLKKAYEDYYHLIDGKAIPYALVEKVRKWYNEKDRDISTFDNFLKRSKSFQRDRNNENNLI